MKLFLMVPSPRHQETFYQLLDSNSSVPDMQQTPNIYAYFYVKLIITLYLFLLPFFMNCFDYWFDIKKLYWVVLICQNI